MRRLLLGLIVLAFAAGIAVQTGLATPLVEWRVERSLVASGVSERRAECMAGRMAKRLSAWQLYRLSRAMAPQDGEAERATGLRDLILRLRRVEDGEVVGVVATSAGLCAVGIG
jgi:hypothetical protein